jgi:hypothetical protein
MRNLLPLRPLLLLLVFVVGQNSLSGQTSSADIHEQKIRKTISVFHVGEKIAVTQYGQPKSTGVFQEVAYADLVYTETSTGTTRRIPVSQIRSIHEILTGHHIGIAIYIGLVVTAGVATALALH